MRLRLTFTRAALICGLALSAKSAGAEEEAQSLAATLRALFGASPAFHVYDVQTREARATHLSSSGAFDTTATAAAQANRTLLTDGVGAYTNRGYDELSVRASLGTTIRENISAQITGSAPLRASALMASIPDQPQVSASLTIPLLKLGRSAGPSSEERATGFHSSAIAALQEDSEVAMASAVAEDYWRWVASYEQLKLARRIDALTLDQLRDVDELIAHNAKAAIERLPFAAAAENAAATRADAEQLMFDSQQHLWQTMGLPAPTNPSLPASDLPTIPAAPLDARALAVHAHESATERPLLKYLDQETAAAGARAEGARIGQRPDLSVIGQASAARVDNYASAIQSPYGYSTQTQLGYFGGVTLQFSFPLQNRAARGAAAYTAEVDRERVLAAQQRANAVTVRIDALAHALETIGRAYHQRTSAASHFEQSYDAERAKFKLGSATGMDVVIAEQQFMQASLATVADRTAYAVTLAQYLYESGTLTSAVRARDTGAVARVLATPPL